MKRPSMPLLLFFFCSALLGSQEMPRVAVLPFEARGVSQNEASIVTTLFETTLVKTGMFTIVEQTEMDQILKTQSLSLSGCTDESCAIQIGQLLSVEEIVLGSFATIGSQYVINAKLIDVEKGRNLRAESVTFKNLDDLIDQVNLLGYQLAGLTYSTGTGPKSLEIVTSLGELFIDTVPGGADIYINGQKKGTSPDLFPKIPAGEAVVEARSGNMYARKSVTVGAEMQKVTLTLANTYGNLFVKSSQKGVSVFLDGMDMGELDLGLYENITVGEHLLEVKNSALYWKSDITISEGQTTRIEAYPREAGDLYYSLPEGAKLEVQNFEFTQSGITGEGYLRHLFAGKYKARITGDIYEPVETDIVVSSAKIAYVTPEMNYNDAYRERMAAEEYENIAGRIRVFSEEIKTVDNPSAMETELLSLRFAINRGLQQGLEYGELQREFSEIEKEYQNRAADVSYQDRIDDLYKDMRGKLAEKETLNYRLSTSAKKVAAQRTAGWIFLGLGGAGAAFTGTSLYLGDAAYKDYLAAADTLSAVELRKDVELWDAMWIAGASAGAAGLITGLIFALLPDPRPGLQKQIDRLDAEIAAIQGRIGLEEMNK